MTGFMKATGLSFKDAINLPPNNNLWNIINASYQFAYLFVREQYIIRDGQLLDCVVKDEIGNTIATMTLEGLEDSVDEAHPSLNLRFKSKVDIKANPIGTRWTLEVSDKLSRD